MLPNLRFAVGAVLASLLLIVTVIGLAATARIAHHAKVGPIETPRPLAYADPTDWAQLTTPDRLLRVGEGARKHDLASIQPRPERTLIGAPPPASAAARRSDDPEGIGAVVLAISGSGSDARAVVADAEPRAKPLPEPKPPIAPITLSTDSSPALVRTATVVDIAAPKADAIPIIDEPKQTLELIATLSPPADAASAEPKATAPQVTSGPLAQKATPQATKRKAAKRKARVRTAKRWTAESGYRATATRNSKDSWMFANGN